MPLHSPQFARTKGLLPDDKTQELDLACNMAPEMHWRPGQRLVEEATERPDVVQCRLGWSVPILFHTRVFHNRLSNIAVLRSILRRLAKSGICSSLGHGFRGSCGLGGHVYAYTVLLSAERRNIGASTIPQNSLH